MSVRECEVFGPKKCEKCGKTIEKGSRALGDFDAKPYCFWHVECLQGPKESGSDDFREAVLAVLSDHTQDLMKIKACVLRIEDKLISLGYHPSKLQPSSPTEKPKDGGLL